MAFFEALNFTSSNEDGETELAALTGARRILCLTGTGTRVLDLLLSKAEAVIALDANPVQNALLALKVAAVAELDRDDCLAFLGIAQSKQRGPAYAAIRHRLPPDSRAYWDSRPRMIASGIWHAGKWEKLLRWNARFLSLARGRAMIELMMAPTVELQARIWKSRFVPGPLQRAAEAIGRDLVWRLAMREPAAAFLPGAKEVSERMEADFARAASSFLFRNSDTATLAMRGRHDRDGALPVHLRAENYQSVREGLGRLHMVETGLADLAMLDLAPCDGFSLSDFGSYCGGEDYAACWRGIVSKALPGARYCERVFMNEMLPPYPEITIDAALSQQLSLSDKSIIYRIRTGAIGAGVQ